MWLILVQPMLFGTIGTEIDFHTIPGSLYPKALALIGAGEALAVSCCSDLISSCGSHWMISLVLLQARRPRLPWRCSCSAARA